MDLALWDAPVVRVAGDSCFYNINEWYCDFHFGYGQDVIEEEALNKTSCMQVLKILIAKADVEIMQLEDQISVLETSLAFANTELSGLFDIVRERTDDCLDNSIQLCKDENDEHDPMLQLQSHSEPTKGKDENDEREIIKGLPCKGLQQQTNQVGSATASIPSILTGVVGTENDLSKCSEAREGERRIEGVDYLDKFVKQNPHDRPQQNIIPFTEYNTTKSPLLAADDITGSQDVLRRVIDSEMEKPKKVSNPPIKNEMEDPSANPRQKMNGGNNIRSSIEDIPINPSTMVNQKDTENPDGKYDREVEIQDFSSFSSNGGVKINCSKTHEGKSLARALIQDVHEYHIEKHDASSVSCVGESREKSVVSMPSSDAKVASSAPISKTELPVSFAEDSCGRQDDNKGLESAREKKDTRKKPVLSQQRKVETDALPGVKGKRKVFTELEPISLNSLLELVNGRIDAKKPHKKVKGKLQASRIKEPKSCLADFSLKKEYTEMKGEHDVKLETVEQNLTEEIGFDVVALEKIKRHKSGIVEPLELINTNIKKEEESDIAGTKLADGSLTSIIIPEDKKMEEKVDILSCSSTSDSRVQIADKISDVSDLEHMTRIKLIEIARDHSLKGYSKLTKAALVTFLVQHLKLGSLMPAIQ